MIRPSVSLLIILCCLSRYISDVNCEECDEEGDIRLADGQRHEGRVEVCLAGEWGTVCDNWWGNNDAAVVCRQLGFSPVVDIRERNSFPCACCESSESFTDAYFGRGDGLDIALNNVFCGGNEERLIDCSATRKDNVPFINCGHDEDAGVRCQPRLPAPTIVNFTVTDTSVFMAWQVNTSLLPNAYFISIRNDALSSRGTSYTIEIEVPGTATEVQYQLIPDQVYAYCLTADYDQETSTSACDSFKIKTSVTSVSPTQPQVGSTSESLIGGVLGFIIVLLVLLLLVAGMGLAYPRCRSKVKDKRYLSSVSQILDRAMYIDHNPSYIQRPPAPSGNDITGENSQGGVNHDPSYEVVGAASDVTTANSHVTAPRSHVTAANSHVTARSHVTAANSHVTAPRSHVTAANSHVTAPRSHVTANLANQHYEQQEPTPRDYEVPVDMGSHTAAMGSHVAAANKEEYSRLEHK